MVWGNAVLTFQINLFLYIASLHNNDVTLRQIECGLYAYLDGLHQLIKFQKPA